VTVGKNSECYQQNPNNCDMSNNRGFGVVWFEEIIIRFAWIWADKRPDEIDHGVSCGKRSHSLGSRGLDSFLCEKSHDIRPLLAPQFTWAKHPLLSNFRPQETPRLLIRRTSRWTKPHRARGRSWTPSRVTRELPEVGKSRPGIERNTSPKYIENGRKVAWRTDGCEGWGESESTIHERPLEVLVQAAMNVHLMCSAAAHHCCARSPICASRSRIFVGLSHITCHDTSVTTWVALYK